jgi:ribosomal-protein-alanine N-acetyltransferase
MSAVAPSKQVTIRRARLEDLGEIMAIERVSFPTPWSEGSMSRELRGQDGGVYLVATVEGKVCGYVGAWIYAGEAHVGTVAVGPEWRGQGLGGLLMLAMLREAQRRGAQRVVLEYRVSNAVAEALYYKLGFRPVGLRRAYYADTGEDAILAALDDLATPQRQEALDSLQRQWEQRHGWQVVFAE